MFVPAPFCYLMFVILFSLLEWPLQLEDSLMERSAALHQISSMAGFTPDCGDWRPWVRRYRGLQVFSSPMFILVSWVGSYQLCTFVLFLRFFSR